MDMRAYPGSATAERARPTAVTELSDIRIEKAANGYTVYCSYKSKSTGLDGPSEYVPPTTHVFEDGIGALAFVSKKLGLDALA